MGYLPTLLVDATSTGRRVLLPLAPIAAAPSSTNKTSPRPVPQDSLHSLGASLETYVERSTLEVRSMSDHVMVFRMKNERV